MRRIWCAGEMAAYVKRRVHIVPVTCNNHVAPDDSSAYSIASLWTDAQKAEVMAVGISIELSQFASWEIRALTAVFLDRRRREEIKSGSSSIKFWGQCKQAWQKDVVSWQALTL